MTECTFYIIKYYIHALNIQLTHTLLFLQFYIIFSVTFNSLMNFTQLRIPIKEQVISFEIQILDRVIRGTEHVQILRNNSNKTDRATKSEKTV